MKVKLKVSIVLDGGVWFPGDVVDLPQNDGQMMIAHGTAERVGGQQAETPLSSNDDIPPNAERAHLGGKKWKK